MIFLGGKHYSAKAIAEILRRAYVPGSPYYESFVGGAHVLRRVADFVNGPMLVSDASEDLMILWRAVAEGFEPPPSMTREEWQALKVAEPSALRSAAGFGLSFSGKWFGGYGAAERPHKGKPKVVDRPCQALARSFVQRRPVLRRAWLECKSYANIEPIAGSLVYWDPPYADTTGYDNVGRFDSEAFWVYATKVSEYANVFVSEYKAPSDWVAVMERQVSSNIKTVASGSKISAKAAEKLFAHSLTLERVKL